jgi:cation transport ATPase
MIQRIQTLYLLAVVALGLALIWLPVVQLVTPEEAETLQVWELSALGGAPLQGLWGLLLTTALIPALALIDIFLYRKRILQARLNIFLVMLCLGYYGVLALYIWLAKMSMNVEWHILPYASFPMICMVLTLMATRRILKDEALVRAADRIR